MPIAIDFADGDQVGLDAEMLDCEEPAGARESALHLVADEDDAVLVADLAQAPRELLARCRDEAALALHGFETIAATSSAATCVVNARRDAASASSALGPRNGFGNGTR